MKLTLLQMTQSILSSLSSDEVNSIADTTESMQVAEVIRQTYFNIISRVNFPEHDQLVQLEPSLDLTQPVIMYIPDGIGKVSWIKYYNSNILGTPPTASTHGVNVDLEPPGWTTTSVTSNTIALGPMVFTVAPNLAIAVNNVAQVVSGSNYMLGTVTNYTGTTLTLLITSVYGTGTYSSWTISQYPGPLAPPGYQYVTILPVKQFLDMTDSFNPSESNVEQFVFTDGNNGVPGTYTFHYKNDKQPQFCTILSDYYVIFDGYDNTQDDTLQQNKTQAYGEVIPTFVMEDSFIPNLDEVSFPLLLNEAKSLAFFELKQSVHSKAEQEAKRGWSSVQRNKSLINRPTYFDALPDFGRRGTMNRSYFKTMGWDR